MTELAPKKADDSVCTMTELVLPSHANSFGNVFGGTIMSWVDLCAAIAAQRHAGHPVVTAFIDDLFFHGPVKVGEVARLEARITATFRTSMEIEVVVTGEEATSGRTWPCVRALLTFVAIGHDGKPTPVPPLLHETAESRARQAEAEERRAHRLSRKST